ncbi:MAG: hypothetical protein EOP58_12150, partial [Sphingomonadales bacterium]
MWDAAAAIGGGLLVLIVTSDIFRSLLVPSTSARILRLGPVLGRTFLPFWHSIADHLPSPRLRQATRASIAPLMLVVSLIVWVLLL